MKCAEPSGKLMENRLHITSSENARLVSYVLMLFSFFSAGGCTVEQYSKIEVLASEVSFNQKKGSFKRADAESVKRYPVIGNYYSSKMIAELDEIVVIIDPRSLSSYDGIIIGYRTDKAKEPISLEIVENRIIYQSQGQEPLSREIDSSKTSMTRRSFSKIGDVYLREGRVSAKIRSNTKTDEKEPASISFSAFVDEKLLNVDVEYRVKRASKLDSNY